MTAKTKEPRNYRVAFTSTTGQRIETKPLTYAEADRKMRSTQWTRGSNPEILRILNRE